MRKTTQKASVPSGTEAFWNCLRGGEHINPLPALFYPYKIREDSIVKIVCCKQITAAAKTPNGSFCGWRRYGLDVVFFDLLW